MPNCRKSTSSFGMFTKSSGERTVSAGSTDLSTMSRLERRNPSCCCPMPLLASGSIKSSSNGRRGEEDIPAGQERKAKELDWPIGDGLHDGRVTGGRAKRTDERNPGDGGTIAL